MRAAPFGALKNAPKGAFFNGDAYSQSEALNGPVRLRGLVEFAAAAAVCGYDRARQCFLQCSGALPCRDAHTAGGGGGELHARCSAGAGRRDGAGENQGGKKHDAMGIKSKTVDSTLHTCLHDLRIVSKKRSS